MHRFTQRGLLKSDSARLVLIGCALEAVYLLYLLRSFPLINHYEKPLLDLGKIAGFSQGAGYSFLLAFTALYLLYYAAYRIALRHGPANLGIVVFFSLVFAATLVMVYPIGAADVFDYIAEARVLSVYHANPFVQVPAGFPADPFVVYAAWPLAPAAYGPLWTGLSAGVTLLAGNGLLTNIFAFKLLAVIFYLACIWVIHGILARTAARQVLAGTLFFAWNPLVVFEVSANAHNDIVMVFFLLLAIVLLQQDRKKLSVAALAFSYLIKYITILLLPLFLASAAKRIHGLKSRLAFLVLSMLISALLSGALYLPFWSGTDPLSLSRRQEMFTVSLPTVALTILGPLVGEHEAQLVISRLALVLLGAFVAYQTWRTSREPWSVTRISFEVLFFFLAFACLWFQPWYLMWLVALAALLTRVDIAHRTMLFCYSATMIYFMFVFYWVWNAPSLNGIAIQQHAAVVVYFLPIAYTGYTLINARLANRKMVSRET